MIIRHQSVRGTCLFCGMKTGHLHLPDIGAEEQFDVAPDGTIRHEDPIYRECPRARWILGLLYFGLFMPFIFLTGGWAPALFVLLLGLIGTALVFPPSERKWVGLSEVKSEYDSLVRELKASKRTYYLRSLEESLVPLFKLRDRALNMVRALADMPTVMIENQLDVIRARSIDENDAELVEIYRAQIRDLYQLVRKREQMQRFLTRFEASKKSVAASINLLKSKILTTEQTDSGGEERRIMDDLKMLHAIYERVNESGQKAGSGSGERQETKSVVSGGLPEPDAESEISEELRRRLENLPSRAIR